LVGGVCALESGDFSYALEPASGDEIAYGVSDRTGRMMIPNVPDGRYGMDLRAERSLPESLKTLERTVVFRRQSVALPKIKVIENSTFTPDHKNKYGQDYVPPAGSSY
jgi:hypothetical protein